MSLSETKPACCAITIGAIKSSAPLVIETMYVSIDSGPNRSIKSFIATKVSITLFPEASRVEISKEVFSAIILVRSSYFSS